MIEEFLALPLSELERLLEAVERRRVTTPVSEPQLMTERFDVVRPLIGVLQLFDRHEALEAFLRSVVIQRRQIVHRPHPQVVWTGPEPIAGRARSTAVVVQDLFEGAQKEVFIAGYAFDKSEKLLRPLYEAMRDRGVTTKIVLNCSSLDVYEETPPERILERVVAEFSDKRWVFGDPRPTLYHDPRTLLRKRSWGDAPWFPEYSMHAKCIVVDQRHVLVGSANFTDRAQTRNIEVGVLLSDEAFARGLLHQWNAAIAAGMVRDAQFQSKR